VRVGALVAFEQGLGGGALGEAGRGGLLRVGVVLLQGRVRGEGGGGLERGRVLGGRVTGVL